MVSTRPPTSNSSSPFSNPLVTVPNAPITIDIIVTSMFHSFFNSLARSRYLSVFSHSFSFILWSAGTAKSTILQILFIIIIIIIIRSGLLAEIRWFMCMSKSHYYYYYSIFGFTSCLIQSFTVSLPKNKRERGSWFYIFLGEYFSVILIVFS